MVSLLVASDVGEGLHRRFVGLSSANANRSLDGRKQSHALRAESRSHAQPLVELELTDRDIGGD
jgi:hypothetical protein